MHMTRRLVSSQFRRYLLCVVSGLATVFVPGCGAFNATSTELGNANASTQELHDHFPEHWPYTIFAASQRLNELVDAPDKASDHHEVAPRKEFSDLVGWLPVLTADSELDRGAFDRIDAWSHDQSVRLSKLDKENGTLADFVADQQVQEMIRWLAETCQAEQRRLDQLDYRPINEPINEPLNGGP